uniref:Dolichyl-diphosphooligosaccharide--protein glycosyltransferase subunit 2 n=1 Tax=Clastoptera arizonana TaxID=38151 RepID=A0A1B6DAG0_9HEMI
MIGYSILWFLSISLYLTHAATTTTSFLSTTDRSRLQQVFHTGIESKDLASIHFAVLGYKLLEVPVPNSQEICIHIVEFSKSAITIEANYYICSIWKLLGCTGASPLDKSLKSFDGALGSETSNVADLYFAVQGYTHLGQKLKDSAKILNTLQAALKKDDGLYSLGYSYHIASQLEGDKTPLFNRIEDAVVQADEVDGRFLQFEGGLSITALIVSGAYKLSAAMKKPPPITGDQAVKFANYFLSRRSVQTSKGAYCLLEVLNTLTTNQYHNPVVISFPGQGVVSSEQPKLSVHVTNLLGKPLTTDPLSLSIESATRVSDDVVVLSKKKFEPTSDKTVYSVNIMEAKTEPGLYKLSVNAMPIKPDPKLVGNVGVILSLKVICAVSVDNFEIGLGDADQTTQPKFDKVAHPQKLPRDLQADSLQKLVTKFSLKDKQSGKALVVHQAFLRFFNTITKQEIIFVSEPDASNNYRFELDIGAKAAEFGQLSGLYNIYLIIGDAILSNSFTWHVADIQLKLSLDSPAQVTEPISMYKPKHEIKHLFREPERRPPVVVSNFFTGLVTVPFFILLILWAKIGVNISNFPFSLYAVGFHIGLGAIFALFGCFWLKLNMFQTLKYLLGLGIVTFLCGNKLLSSIAKKRKQ